jgi:hypothetical protein
MLKHLISGNVEFSIPAHQVCVYILIIVLCLLFAKYRAGLLISFIFTFYWVFIINKDKIRTFTGGSNEMFMVLYFICGAIVVGLSLWSFYVDE